MNILSKNIKVKDYQSNLNSVILDYRRMKNYK